MHCAVNVRRNRSRIAIAVPVVTLALCAPAKACVILIDDFTQMQDALFVDVDGAATSASAGSVAITGTPPGVGILGLGGAHPSSADPGDKRGWAAGSIVQHRFGDVPVILDFDIGVAGFGVSFMHFLLPRFEPFNVPAVLEVFDMPGGTGNLIGRTQSKGGDAPLIDFVAVWNSAPTIRSAVLSTASGSFAADGYAITLTPVSEPPAGALTALAFAICGRRKWLRQLLNRFRPRLSS